MDKSRINSALGKHRKEEGLFGKLQRVGRMDYGFGTRADVL